LTSGLRRTARASNSFTGCATGVGGQFEFAPWALTVMPPGGTCIIPLLPRGTHPEDLLPGNLLTLWLYTDMSDPR